MKTRTEKFPAICHREFTVEMGERVEPSAEGGATLYPVSLSSEAPVRQYNWATDSWYDEVLSHDRSDVDMSRAKDDLPLHQMHWYGHIGSVRQVELDEKRKRLVGMAEFSSIPIAQEKETLLREGHLRSVSVGYKIKSMELLSRDSKTGIPTYRCKWMPVEVCTASVPADPKIGFGRNANDQEVIEVMVDDHTEDRAMDENQGNQTTQTPAAPVTQARSEAAPVQPAPATVGHDYERDMKQIGALAGKHPALEAKLPDWLSRGLTFDQVRTEAVEILATRGNPIQPSAEALSTVPTKDMRNYSYQRAINQAIEMRSGKQPSGFEGEIHRMLERSLPVEVKRHNGILMPFSNGGQRTMTSVSAGAGAESVFDQPGDLIEILRNKAYVLAMGARVYDGLTSPVPFLKHTADMVAYWMGENPGAGVTASDLGTALVHLAPKTLMATGTFSRQLLAMSSLINEASIRESIGSAHGLKIDHDALHGIGASGEPTGIYSAADVLTETVGGVPSYANFVSMISKVADANADQGSLGFMTTPLMAGVMMATLEASAAGAKWIWTGRMDNGQIAGYPARATNQVSKTLGTGADHGILFGNWNDLLIGLWGIMEMTVDPYTLADYGLVKMTSFQMADILLRRGESFCKALTAVIEAGE